MSTASAPAGIAILLWAASPERPQLLATPFFYAAAAAAVDARVEIYFSADSVRLLVPGIAERLHASDRYDKTIHDNLREAVEHGVRLLACTDALHARGIDPAGLIPECHGHGGAVQFMERTLDPDWRTLVF